MHANVIEMDRHLFNYCDWNYNRKNTFCEWNAFANIICSIQPFYSALIALNTAFPWRYYLYQIRWVYFEQLTFVRLPWWRHNMGTLSTSQAICDGKPPVHGRLPSQEVTQIAKFMGVNIEPTWVLSAPDGPHVGPMNLAFRVLMWSFDIFCFAYLKKLFLWHHYNEGVYLHRSIEYTGWSMFQQTKIRPHW